MGGDIDGLLYNFWGVIPIIPRTSITFTGTTTAGFRIGIGSTTITGTVMIDFSVASLFILSHMGEFSLFIEFHPTAYHSANLGELI